MIQFIGIDGTFKDHPSPQLNNAHVPLRMPAPKGNVRVVNVRSLKVNHAAHSATITLSIICPSSEQLSFTYPWK